MSYYNSYSGDDREFTEGCFWFIVGLLFICAVFLYPIMECEAKTVDIGFEHRWGALSGCQIEVKDGKWIPLESYYFKQE